MVTKIWGMFPSKCVPGAMLADLRERLIRAKLSSGLKSGFTANTDFPNKSQRIFGDLCGALGRCGGSECVCLICT